MVNKIIKGLFVGGACFFGGYVIKKLKDIHKEIIYFEDQKGIYDSRKEHYERMKNIDYSEILKGLNED